MDNIEHPEEFADATQEFDQTEAEMYAARFGDMAHRAEELDELVIDIDLANGTHQKTVKSFECMRKMNEQLKDMLNALVYLNNHIFE